MVNAQQWLDKEYPIKQRGIIKDLHIRNKKLKGSLDLRDFVSLEALDCSYNQLTHLNLTGLEQLKVVCCNDNCLTDLDYSSLNANKLTFLNISDNNLSEQDLSVFSCFTNLLFLWIGNEDERKIQQSIYNRFYGSLENLKKCNKLERLHISNTDINNGVYCLSDRIKGIYYSTKERPESKLKEIEEEINSFLARKTNEDWKDIHFEFDKQKQKEWQNMGFNYQQTKEWIKVGLQPNEYHFATYLRANGYNSQQGLDWEKFRKESRNSQEWLDKKYPLDKRKKTTWLDISKNGLEGSLVITKFPNLEKLECGRNQLTSLTLDNLPKVTYIHAYDNKITDLTINNCPEINRLDITNNFLTKLDFLSELNPNKLVWLQISNNKFSPLDVTVFRKFVKLERLWLANNQFYGNLQNLKTLSKLEHLITTNTEINNDFEYLSNSLKEVTSAHSQDLQKDDDNLKIVRWTDVVRGNSFEYYKFPLYDFHYWKETQPYFKWLEEELKKINPKLNIYDVLGDIFFNVKTGDFEGDLQSIISLLQVNKVLFDQKEKEIDLLEFRIKELENLIKQQKEKIVQAYLHFSSEKDLLQELVKISLEFAEFKKKKINHSEYAGSCEEYEEKCHKIKKKLRSKLGKESMNEIYRILADCEELVVWELEIENKFNDKLSLLDEEQKQTALMSISTNLDSLKKRLQSHMEQQQLAELIKEKVNGKIKGIERLEVFSTWFNDNCAIVINKEKNYNLWIVIYEPFLGKTKEKINCLKVAKLPPIKEKWEEIIEHFKKSLNSDYSATEVLNNIYTFKLPSLVKDYGNIEKRKIEVSLEFNHDDYLKPYDIIKRKIDRIGMTHHYAIYLGNGQVAHIYGSEEERHDRKDLGARIDTWEKFLDDKKEIEIHHPFIPFKRPELIQKHIDIAVKAKYGEGEYHLLKNNCEHFATMCVYGVGMSRQPRPNTANAVTKNSNYLLEAIQETNRFFKELKKQTEIRMQQQSQIEQSPK